MDIHDTITRLARPQVVAMHPYTSARKEGEQNGAWAQHDANEILYPPYPGTEEQEGLNCYPEPQPALLLDAFTRLYGVARDQILVLRGADEAIDLLTRAFCREGVDGVLVHPPTFVMFEHSARIQGAIVHEVPLRPADFQLDIPRMLDTCLANPTIRLVFICSPNNPTGNLMRRENILELSRKLAGQALVVVDEVYLEYSGQPSLSAEIAQHPNLVVLRSLSKEYALAGERCGILLAHPEVIDLVGRIHAPYPLTVSSVRAITKAMSPKGVDHARRLREQILRDRRTLEQALAASPAVRHVFPSDTNFLLLQGAVRGGVRLAGGGHPRPHVLLQCLVLGQCRVLQLVPTCPVGHIGIGQQNGCARFDDRCPQCTGPTWAASGGPHLSVDICYSVFTPGASVA